MLTKKDLVLGLKETIKEGFTPAQIGSWVYSNYLQLNEEVEEELWPICTQLAAMEVGPEFEFTIEELQLIAEKLLLEEENPIPKIIQEKLKCQQ
ncbi:hypothetical protein NEOC65_001872 [Neochlamydia sp. AcF65]|uniref:hypothetical protein n=1 Tax=Neochlamydia sp. AcF65 TaxID=2795735 RepID=UPI001BCA1DC9|nr:hypothetical protein [Neochlamydia sp. AcF65]MBS4166778.1 hypothetical protein [Neochlamydia sp. AcF65]